MGKRILCTTAIAVVLLVNDSRAQQNVGIGTNSPHPTALLELYSTSKGLLIPRMTQAERDAISSPATGLLIYQTDNNPGFYYWNGTAWIPLLSSSSGSGLFWSLTGNAGTNPATNFLGTTDNQPLVIKVNNQQTFRFNTDSSLQRDDGGNVRGRAAVDLQIFRVHPSQVASGVGSVIGGGGANVASDLGATVSGGLGNTASDTTATVGGGWENTASGLASTVSGGYSNTASGDYATVGGGAANTASGDYSAIPGGYNLRVGARSFGFSGQTSPMQTDLSAVSNIAAFVDVDLWLYNVRNQASQLRLYEPSGAGTNYTAFRAQAQAADITYTLPASLTPTSTVAVGILQTDASGNLSWVTPSAVVGAGAWALTGNAGTNPATNFLGTTDAQPLVIRVGNQETFRFNAPGTSAPGWSIQRGGGNTRGLHAVDLQSARTAATQVAGGDYSVIGGGQNNTASGYASTVGGGYLNNASGDYSAIPGGYNLRVGARSFGFSGQTSVTQTDLSAVSNIAAFVDVDLWLYSRDRTQASQLRLYEGQAHGTGANYIALRAPASLTANTTYTLPASAPATSAAWLQSDNTGNMTWRPVLYGTVNVDPPNIGANASVTFTITITGVQTNDLIFLTPPSDIEAALVFQGATVTSANTVTIRMRNVTGAAVDGASRTWRYMVIRP